MQHFSIDRQINDYIERLGRIFRPRRFIGLAVEERAMLAAEVRCEKGRFLVSRVNHFVFPEGASFKEPEGLGKALGRFLQENRFGAKKAIIGIPAKWLMIKEKAIPASTRENITGILKIYAEREFSLSPEELAMDYTGLAADDRPNRHFILAMLRANLDNAVLAVRWAGLDVLSVTASTAALFSRIRACMPPPAPNCLLYIREGYAEFLAADGGQTVDVRHVQRDIRKETGLFIAELRRITSSGSNGPLKEGKGQLLIWNAAPYACGEELKALADSLPAGTKLVETGDRAFADRLDLPEVKDAERLAAPVMLAEAYGSPDPFYIDFLNSRMNVMTSIIKKSHVLWASAAAFGMVILFMVMFFMWRGDKRDISELRSKLDGMKEDISDARDVIQKVSMAGGWYSERPRILDCLTALTTAFPEEGRIWVTSLALTEELAGVVSGRATDEKIVIEILDQLKGNGLFSNVQMIYLQDNGRTSGEVSFSMNFSYTGKE